MFTVGLVRWPGWVQPHAVFGLEGDCIILGGGARAPGAVWYTHTGMRTHFSAFTGGLSIQGQLVAVEVVV